MAVTWNRGRRAYPQPLEERVDTASLLPRVARDGARTNPPEVSLDRLLELPISDGTWVEEYESMTPLAEGATDGVLRWWRAQRPYVETHTLDVDFCIQKVCHERKNN